MSITGQSAITYGTVGATSITGKVSPNTLASRVSTTIGGTDYVRSPPIGYPDPNPGVAGASSKTAFPQTIKAAAVVTLFSDEKAALVAAGAAS